MVTLTESEINFIRTDTNQILSKIEDDPEHSIRVHESCMKLRRFKTIPFASILNFSKVVSNQLKFRDTDWLIVFGYLRQFLHRLESCSAKLKSISPNTPRDLTKNNHFVTLLFKLAKKCEPLAISDILNTTSSRENSRIHGLEQSLVKVQAQKSFSTKPNY
jgi:hypothetical protein